MSIEQERARSRTLSPGLNEIIEFDFRPQIPKRIQTENFYIIFTRFLVQEYKASISKDAKQLVGPCLLFDENAEDLVIFSQVCKQARTASLPFIWNKFMIRSSRDFFHAMKIFNSYRDDSEAFKEIYGKYVETLEVWIEDDFDGRKSKRVQKRARTFIYKTGTRKQDEGKLTYLNLEEELIGVVKAFKNLTKFHFRFEKELLTKDIAEVIKKECPRLKDIVVSPESIDLPVDGALLSLLITGLSLSMENQDGLNLIHFIPIFTKSESDPFGFRLSEAGSYSKDERLAVRIINLCKIAICYKVKEVILPYNEEFFLETNLWPLWTWLKVVSLQDSEGDKFVKYHSWANAFANLNQIMKSRNSPKTSNEIKNIKTQYLSQKDVASTLDKNPDQLFKEGVDDDELIAHYTSERTVYILTILGYDQGLLNAIINAKQEVGKFIR